MNQLQTAIPYCLPAELGPRSVVVVAVLQSAAVWTVTASATVLVSPELVLLPVFASPEPVLLPVFVSADPCHVKNRLLHTVLGLV